jgi:hypothetical protein
MSQVATTSINFPKEGYYLYLDGQNQGPLSQEQVMERFQKGLVQRTTPLWFPGLANWITVADMPELDRRKLQSAETPVPEKDRPEAIIVQVKGQAVPLLAQSIKALIVAEDFRRTDLVYDEGAKNWIRSDQHSVVKLFYSMPSPPNALAHLSVVPAAAPAAAAVSATAAPSATFNATPKNTGAPQKSAAGSSKKRLVALGTIFFILLVLGAAAHFYLK